LKPLMPSQRLTEQVYTVILDTLEAGPVSPVRFRHSRKAHSSQPSRICGAPWYVYSELTRRALRGLALAARDVWIKVTLSVPLLTMSTFAE